MSTSWTWHGGGIEAARRCFGGDAEHWIDLSTGINPHVWPDAAKMDIDWRRLPERDALAGLEEAAAAYFGAEPRHVCAVPGTEVGLRLVGRIVGGPAHHVAPTYRTHVEMMPGSGPVTTEEAAACEGTLILANPNNPDGRTLRRSVLLDLADNRREDAWLLLDEAFADVDPTLSIADEIGDARRLVIFRSFGKFFGLAGLRLGFVLAPTPVIASLREALGAWPVSAAAIAIGSAAYRDEDWISAMRERLPREATALDQLLAAVDLRTLGDCPLFRLIQTEQAPALFERLAHSAILTRPFADNPHWLRIGLPADAEATARLRTALANG